MLRLVIIIILFLLSLLTIFRAPTNLLWYISILVTEFSWIFFIVAIALLMWNNNVSRYNTVSTLIGLISMILFAIPIFEAYRVSAKIEKMFPGNNHPPYSFWKTFTGINATQKSYETITYDSTKGLTLDFYQTGVVNNKPCIVVVHGGSWSGGDSRQLPELNSELVKAGYPVAAINYRLAPKYIYPAPVEDVRTALSYLRQHAFALRINATSFVLLGRSAGGQIVISAAYTLNDPAIKGVISFYGPLDMVWGYANPTNPLVLNSRKVMSDYLGGSYVQVPGQYINSSGTETVTASAAPTLLIHGENDPLVSHLHGTRLARKLDSLGTKHFDIYMPWATHGFDWTLNGPGGQISTWSVMHFLEQLNANK